MRPKPALAELRARIAILEGIAPVAGRGTPPLRLEKSLDRALPWGGLPQGMMHEIAPAAPSLTFGDGAALGFAAHLLARLAAARERPVLWVAERDPPYAPGLVAFGLTPERLVVVAGGRPSEILWALEEAAKSRGPAAILGEVRGMDFTAARRLALAARDTGTSVLLLNRGHEAVRSAVTRWRVGGADSAWGKKPDGTIAPRRWHVELAFCRGRGLGEDECVDSWDMEWEARSDGTAGLRLAAESGDRHPAAPQSRVA